MSDRRGKRTIHAAAGVLLAAWILAAAAGLGAPPEETRHRVETDRLVIEWTVDPSEGEVEGVKAEATRTYEAVAEILGERPDWKVEIVMGGPAERDGRRDYPRVDGRGRIRLFTFVPDWNNYFGALAHEMVHAFRFQRRLTADWFFEEGFAEFVALRADPSLAGFPWFDHPVRLVAGQWIASGDDIPIAMMRDRHRELNLPCRAQTYALRSAFFDWLGRTYGDDTVVRMGKEPSAGRLEDYEKFFGLPFDQLAARWRADLLDAFRAMPDGETAARTYRRESPIQYQKVCAAGTDF